MSQTGFNCAVKEKRTPKGLELHGGKALAGNGGEKDKRERKRRENSLGAKIVFSSTLTVLGIITPGFYGYL